MSELNLFSSLMGAIFSGVDGDISLYNCETYEDVVVDSAQEVLDLVSSSDAVHMFSLKTSEGQFAGFTIFHEDRQDAKADIDVLDPSFIMESPDGVYLAYLVDLDNQDIDPFRGLLNDLSDGTGEITVDLPVPYGNWRLSADDEEYLSSGQDFPVYSLNDIESAFFESDPVTTKLFDEAQDIVTTLNDAKIYGNIPQNVWDLPVVISVGSGQEEKNNWKTSPEFKFGDLLTTQLSKHTVGKKDGLCFVTGSVADKKRNKNSVIGLYLMGLDVDSGASLDQTFERVRKLGLCAVFYTTHSHLTDELRIKQDAFYKWASKEGIDPDQTTENVRAYLREQNKYVDNVVDSAEYVNTIHDSGGLHLIIKVRPIEKFRIIFPLKTPYVIAEQKMAQRDAILKWESLILGMGAALGISVDRAARDPSRLFFLPRHPKGAEYEIRIAAGQALNWKDIKGIDPKETVSSDVFDQAGAVMGARIKGRPTTPNGHDLIRWAAERGDGFQITRVFQDHCPDRLRDQTADGKFTVECPFDEDHSNAGDPDDKGCFIVDAGAHADQFQFRCSHNGCSGRDRLAMVEKAIIDGWFPEDVILDDTYDSLVRDTREADDEEPQEDDEDDAPPAIEQPERKNSAASYDRVSRMAQATTQNSSAEDIRDILKLCIDLNEFDRKRIFNVLVKNVKVTAASINQAYSDVSAEAADNSGLIDDAVYDALEAAARTSTRFRSLKDSGKPTVVMNPSQPVKTVNYFIQVLNEVNSGRPEKIVRTPTGKYKLPPIEGLKVLYSYGSAKVRIQKSVNGTFTPEKLTKEIISNIAKDHINTVNIIDATSYEETFVPDDICTMTLHDGQLSLLPLDNFATMPFFDANHSLVTESGYHAPSRRILRMSPEMEELIENRGNLILRDPTKEQVDQAVDEILNQIFGDFPFNDGEEGGQSSKAHFLCMILQPLVRDLIDGSTPMYVVDKPSAGTGASLLITMGMLISTGQLIGTTAMSSDREEIRKTISANMSAGRTITFFDNVNETLQSQDIANLATGKVWEDRMLGQSEIISIKNVMQVIFAGNNVEMTDEILRRMLLIRLDARDDPTEREGFKIDNLELFVDENKFELFCHLLTIVNYWVKQGSPKWKGKPLASFENYCAVMGGILQTVGVEGFLGNRHLTSSANSPDKLAWASFIQQWISKIGLGKFVTIKDLVSLYIGMDNMPTLRVNGGGIVRPNDDESRVYAPMARLIDKQTNQVFRVYYMSKETKVVLKKKIDREKGTTTFAIELLDA